MKNYTSKLINLDSIIPYPDNPKIHDDEQIALLAGRIAKEGFNQPIVVDHNMVIVKGHGRRLAATKLGLEKVPVVVLNDLTKAEIKAARIADNQVSLLTGYDDTRLKLELEGLAELDISLDDLGFKLDDLDDLDLGLSDDEKEQSEEIEDDIPEVDDNPYNVKRGDIWVLGEHRLMCGDSTSKDDVDRLMDGEKADMVFTDPPYGIDEETDRAFSSMTRKCKGNSFKKIAGDKDTTVALASIEIARELGANCNIFWGGNYYDIEPSPNWIVWDKRVEENQKDMNSDCELAYVDYKHKASVRIFRHLWKGMIKASEHGQARVHPTQKPIALAEWCFENYGEPKSVLDLFLGSGSTLIACEKTDRKCFGMEIDPHYVSVILKRWEEYTGKEAEKMEG
jgi:DNA modification methylase